MSDQCYSADLIVTAQDSAECNWESALANVEREVYRICYRTNSGWGRG